VTSATVISYPPARGRAFAHPLADCGRIADLAGIQEPRNHPQFPRALSHRPPYPPIGPLFPVHVPVFCKPARARARVCLAELQVAVAVLLITFEGQVTPRPAVLPVALLLITVLPINVLPA